MYSEQPTPQLNETNRIFLGLGSNLGQRLEHLMDAARYLEEAQLEILNCSSLYETAPVELLKQPDFFNLNLEIKTDLPEDALLESCLSVEKKMGRIRKEPKGPRIIDIDILFYGQRISRSKQLSVPHPAIAQRRFVLVPMVEIAPEFRDPLSGYTMRRLLHRCPDLSSVRWIQPFRHEVP